MNPIVYSRYNPVPVTYVNQVGSVHRTEQGLVIPIAKLVERFSQGKEVPHLLGSIYSSIPFGNSFSSDLLEKYKNIKQLNFAIEDIKSKIPA